MDLLKEIGAILGFVAFAGFVVLVFITFQQARHLRRLRDWAGRSPERAEADADRAAAAADEAAVAADPIGAPPVEPAAESRPGRMQRLRGEVAFRYEEMDRRLPVSPLVLFGGLLALVVAAAILTSGFGLVDSGSGGGSEPTATNQQPEPDKIEVAVLNGTAPAEGQVGIPGTANAAAEFVEDAGYKVGEVGDSPPFAASTVMFEDGFKSDAAELAADMEDTLGQTETTAITPEIQAIAKGADLVLIVGLDDQGLAG